MKKTCWKFTIRRNSGVLMNYYVVAETVEKAIELLRTPDFYLKPDEAIKNVETVCSVDLVETATK